MLPSGNDVGASFETETTPSMLSVAVALPSVIFVVVPVASRVKLSGMVRAGGVMSRILSSGLA